MPGRGHRLTTGFDSVPMPSMVTATVWPGCIGPIPAGVPVSRTSPGSSVMQEDAYETSVGDVVQEHGGARGLLDLAVESRLDRKVGRIEIGLHPRPQRAERVVALGPRPLPVGRLLVAGGHVVAAGVAEDDVIGLLDRDVAAQPPDHDGKLALVVDTLAVAGVGDGLHRARRQPWTA